LTDLVEAAHPHGLRIAVCCSQVVGDVLAEFRVMHVWNKTLTKWVRGGSISIGWCSQSSPHWDL